MDENDNDQHRVWKSRRKNGQFKKGVSGNPSGRPKRKLSTNSVFKAMLASKVPVTRNGITFHLTVVEAIAERVKREALTGTLRGLEKGVLVAQKYSLDDPTEEGIKWDMSVLTDEELEMYGRLLAKTTGRTWEKFNQEAEMTSDNEGAPKHD